MPNTALSRDDFSRRARTRAMLPPADSAGGCVPRDVGLRTGLRANLPCHCDPKDSLLNCDGREAGNSSQSTL